MVMLSATASGMHWETTRWAVFPEIREQTSVVRYLGGLNGTWTKGLESNMTVCSRIQNKNTLNKTLFLNKNKMSLDSLFWFLLLLECKLLNESFLFFFAPSPSITSANPPTSRSCFFRWSSFCQVIISHRLVEHSVISEACTSLLLFIQTRLKHLIFKSKSTDFFSS